MLSLDLKRISRIRKLWVRRNLRSRIEVSWNYRKNVRKDVCFKIDVDIIGYSCEKGRLAVFLMYNVV